MYKVCKGFASKKFASILNSSPTACHNLRQTSLADFSRPLFRLDIQHNGAETISFLNPKM